MSKPKALDGGALAVDFFCRMAPGLDKILRFYTQPFGDAGKIIEGGDHLGGVVDGTIVKPMFAKYIQIRGRYRLRFVRELRGKIAQRPVGRRKRRRPPVPCDGVHKAIGLGRVIQDLSDLFPEVVRVGLHSVMTSELGGNHRRQRFTLNPRQR